LRHNYIMAIAAAIRRESISTGRKIAPDAIIMATGQVDSDVVITRK
jgi:hypothetical protein